MHNNTLQTGTLPTGYLNSRRFSVAPMMDWTDKHYRYFARLITQHALLYTEMVHAGAIVYNHKTGEAGRFLDFNAAEHPIALQLGGSEPTLLAEAAKIAEGWGYDEINLNVGCPSERVQRGAFGACLMAEPSLVANCFAAMQKAVSVPVTIKCRIGINDQVDYAFLQQFIDPIIDTGCEQFTLHARTAILKGLSPKENREIPPLNYPRVYQLKRDYPQLHISINGGIASVEGAAEHLKQGVDGVMMGRAAYQTPYTLAEVDSVIFNDDRKPKRADILAAYADYIEQRLAEGVRLHHMTRHILGLCRGIPGASRWRRHLSEQANRPDAGLDVLTAANQLVLLDP